jgi:hypothetical protein
VNPYLAGVLLALSACIVACGRGPEPVAATPAPAAKPAIPFKLTAGITDLMRYEIDPSADALWDSVGTYVDKHGTENRQPHTPQQWAEIRGRAIILAEAANLLMMEGRPVAVAGHEVEDTGTPGNLSAAEAQAAIDKDRAVFLSFARALGDVAVQMIKAADEKNASALWDEGAALDEVCEGCHLKFWYPGQQIPRLPEEAPESGAASAAARKPMRAAAQ